MKINGEYLRFADDILIFANSAHELQQLQQKLADEKSRSGDEQLEDKVDNVKRQRKNLDTEIQRRILAGLAAFAKHRDIFNGNIGTCVKRQLMHTSSNDIRPGNMGTHHPSKEHTILVLYIHIYIYIYIYIYIHIYLL